MESRNAKTKRNERSQHEGGLFVGSLFRISFVIDLGKLSSSIFIWIFQTKNILFVSFCRLSAVHRCFIHAHKYGNHQMREKKYDFVCFFYGIFTGIFSNEINIMLSYFFYASLRGYCDCDCDLGCGLSADFFFYLCYYYIYTLAE